MRYRGPHDAEIDAATMAVINKFLLEDTLSGRRMQRQVSSTPRQGRAHPRDQPFHTGEDLGHLKSEEGYPQNIKGESGARHK